MSAHTSTVILFDVPQERVAVRRRIVDEYAGVSWIPAMFAPFCCGVNVKWGPHWSPAEPIFFSQKCGVMWIEFRIFPFVTRPDRGVCVDYIFDGENFHKTEPEDWERWEALCDEYTRQD